MRIPQLKEIHFILLIIVFTMLVCFIASRNREQYTEVEDKIPEIETSFFADSLNEKTSCLVLFYVEDSDLCNEMRGRLEKLRLSIDGGKLYKINIDKHSELIYKYNIFGVPSVLIFKNGVEDKRIMGVISYSNLEMIYERQK